MISIRRPWIERYMEARRHVINGWAILNRQRDIIARQRVKTPTKPIAIGRLRAITGNFPARFRLDQRREQIGLPQWVAFSHAVSAFRLTLSEAMDCHGRRPRYDGRGDQHESGLSVDFHDFATAPPPAHSALVAILTTNDAARTATVDWCTPRSAVALRVDTPGFALSQSATRRGPSHRSNQWRAVWFSRGKTNGIYSAGQVWTSR
jgi:hypothetical protein